MTTISGSRQKILLINPPSEFKTPVLPLGLASIAAYLKEKNDEFGVFVIDAWAENLGPEELKNKIAKTKADIAGIYMVSPRYDQAKKTIEICRQALPKSLIIAGGPHPSAMPRETLADIPCLDICAIGEGEKIMLELANNAPIEGIKGISYRKNPHPSPLRQKKTILYNNYFKRLPLPLRLLLKRRFQAKLPGKISRQSMRRN